MNHLNLWTSADHALNYLASSDSIPQHTEGKAVLLELVPKNSKRIIDLGTGDGRLLSLLKINRPKVKSIAVNFSLTMLEAVSKRFADDTTTKVVTHNLDEPLPASLSTNSCFDAVVSSFAIHHLTHTRKRALDAEILNLLKPDGVFCNLEHVSSPTTAIQEYFRKTIGIENQPKEPCNELLDMESQLNWLRELGYIDVDCYWNWS
jgi:tRNA (cmo5U34)-methyltransferase